MSERLTDGVAVKLTPKIRAALETIAKDNDKAMSEVAREYILDGLERDGVKVEEK